LKAEGQIRQPRRVDSKTAIMVAIASLIAIAPFGGLATQPLVLLAYRTLAFCIVLVCFWKSRQESGPDFHRGFYLAAGTILGLMLLSVWSSTGSRIDGYAVWYQHLLWAVFFVAVARFSARQQIDWKSWMLVSVIATTLGHLVLGLIDGSPLKGAFLNGNYLGSFMLVGFASSVAISFFHARLSWRVGAALSAISLFYGITETVSRGATIAAIAVVLVALWQMRRRAALVGALGIASVVIVLIVASNPRLVTKFLDRGEVDPYNYSRVEIWMSTLRVIAENPVLGVGPDRYQHVARRFRFPEEGTIGRFSKRQSIAHSEYLHYAAEAGIPAALLIVALILYFVRTLARHRGPSPPAMFLEQAALLAIVGVGLHAGVENNFEPPVVFALLVTVALASATVVTSTPIRFPASTKGLAALSVLIVGAYVESSLSPSIAYYYNNEGNKKQVAQQFAEAELDHRFAVTLQPRDPVLLTNLGIAHKFQYLQTGDAHMLDVADSFYSRATEANPYFLHPRQELTDVLVLRLTGETDRDFNVHRRLIGANQSMLDLDPFLPFTRTNLAEALYRSGDRRRAYEELLKTLEMEPNYVPGYKRLAKWYAEDGNLERSRLLLDKAVSIEREYSDLQDVTDYEAIILGRPAVSP
jgi:O-antigen ligase